ncbi:glycoside hydrolase family 16 protein, partial [bacterium]
FIHVVASDGTMVFQDDHEPPGGTARWSGSVAYTRRVWLPKTLGDGQYRIEAGLYERSPDGKGWSNLTLLAGPGVKSRPDGHYEIGTFVVDHRAPMPRDSDRKPTLNLKGYRKTFDESFDGPLSVSARGPNGPRGTRWIAHKPDGQDFGDARFVDPDGAVPFLVRDGALRITASRDANGWRGGLLSTCDPQGRGFAQTYGYFEMRARFPKGTGTWPAFWMLQRDHLTRPDHPDVEIDVVEAYGHTPERVHTTLHLWRPEASGGHVAWGDTFPVTDTTAGFHRYGVMWDARTIAWSFDGVELWRRPTPPEANSPMYLLVNLALGGGWPITETPNPSTMEVDYVRAYAKNH